MPGPFKKQEREALLMMKLATFYDHIKDIADKERLPMAEAMARAKSLGIGALEVSQNSLLGREDQLGHELAYAGLEISSIPSYFDFGRDTDVDRQSLPTLEAARYLGAARLLIIPGFFQEGDDGKERERQIQSITDCINRLADKACSYGVSLVMEDYDSFLAPFSTTAGVRSFLDRCPGLSCCFDTGNFRFSSEDELEAYRVLRGRIGHVHLKDRAFSPEWGTHAVQAADGQALYPAPVGWGEIQIAAILSALEKDRYTGWCTIEHYGAADMWAALEASAGWLHNHASFT